MLLKKRKNKGDRDEDKPIKIMMGTCPSTKQDTEALARGLIERYFDITSHSWLFLTEEKGVGYHYEIHEAGEGYPILPSILEKATWEEEESYIVKPMNEHAVEVFCKPGKTLSTIVMTKSMSLDAVETKGIGFVRKKRMKPYVTLGTEWVKTSLIALSLGIFTITVAGVLHKSFNIATEGYVELLDTLPSYRLLELAELTDKPKDLISPVSALPISQWERLMSQASAGSHVDKLSYDGKTWSIEKAKSDMAKVPPKPLVDDGVDMLPPKEQPVSDVLTKIPDMAKKMQGKLPLPVAPQNNLKERRERANIK